MVSVPPTSIGETNPATWRDFLGNICFVLRTECFVLRTECKYRKSGIYPPKCPRKGILPPPESARYYLRPDPLLRHNVTNRNEV
uniref:Uncharacterized protein n=1 Tax=uncultured marine virus TaxID=186617 RepID=A0A0F7L3T4_9VIRU|nr:hypothetical protein [uncultured marine virus]